MDLVWALLLVVVFTFVMTILDCRRRTAKGRMASFLTPFVAAASISFVATFNVFRAELLTKYYWTESFMPPLSAIGTVFFINIAIALIPSLIFVRKYQDKIARAAEKAPA